MPEFLGAVASGYNYVRKERCAWRSGVAPAERIPAAQNHLAATSQPGIRNEIPEVSLDRDDKYHMQLENGPEAALPEIESAVSGVLRVRISRPINQSPSALR
jgi:uncharacterized membrane protein